MQDNNLVLEILIVNYLKEYSLLEKDIKDLFKENINSIEEGKESLYFLYGAIEISRLFQFDLKNKKISLGSVRYDKELNKINVNTKNMIKIIDEYNFVKDFPSTIDSVQTPTVNYKVKDVCAKLAEVRNVLAHETGYIEFANRGNYEVETFSKTNLKKYISNILNESDIDDLKETDMLIAGNLVYIKEFRTLLGKLKK